MDAFPPARDGPRFEIQAIGRSLEDLTPAEVAVPRDVVVPMLFTALALIALMAFVGWLLVG